MAKVPRSISTNNQDKKICKIYYFARAAKTKNTRLGGLNNYVSPGGLKGHEQSAGRGWFLLMHLCRWLLLLLFTWPFLKAYAPGVFNKS
jgi:hypothetical protein